MDPDKKINEILGKMGDTKTGLAVDPNNPEDPILISNDETDDTTAEESAKKDGIKSLISTIAILIIAPLIALVLTAFIFQSYEVDGPSMETTLQNHDRLIVYKMPRTISKITGQKYIPKRGDIIIFTRVDDFEFGTAKPRQLIKRVIGLPGETVQVKDGIVKVFNKEHPLGFRPDDAPYGKVIKRTDGAETPVKVPDNAVFVCGDNRGQSLDSRAFGPVPVKDIVGKLALRVYPFGKGESF